MLRQTRKGMAGFACAHVTRVDDRQKQWLVVVGMREASGVFREVSGRWRQARNCQGIGEQRS